MGDKFFLLVLILFVLAGGVVYERYLAGRDGVSPVARMLDSGGLSQALDWRGRRMTAQQKVYRVREKIEGLQDSYHLIEAQRARLSESRAELLGQVSDLSGQIASQSEAYKEMIIKERESFSSQDSDFQQLLNALSEAYLLSNPDDRSQKYHDAKARFYDHLARVSGQSQVDNPLFSNFTAELDQGLGGDPAWEAQCGGREACVRKLTSEFQSQAEDFLGQRLQQSSADINDVVAGVRALKKEEQVFQDNLGSSEALIRSNSEKMQSGFDAVVREITSITDVWLGNLMAAYQAQQEEQEIILSSLELSWQRLKAQHDILDRMVKKIRYGPGVTIGDLSGRYAVPLDGLHTNLTADRDILRSQMQETKNIIASLGGALGAVAAVGRKRPWQAEAHDRRQEQAFRPDGGPRDTTARDRPGQVTARSEAGRPIQAIQPREPLSVSRPGIDITNSAKEQMQRLRDQARDQGFYRK